MKIIPKKKVEIYNRMLSEDFRCIICGGEVKVALKIKKTGKKYYRDTCGKECLSRLKSTNASLLRKRVGKVFF